MFGVILNTAGGAIIYHRRLSRHAFIDIEKVLHALQVLHAMQLVLEKWPCIKFAVISLR
jgi:hypothetical protein